MGVSKNDEPPETKLELDQYKHIEKFEMPTNGCRRMIFVDGCNLIHSGGTTGHKVQDIKIETDKSTTMSVLLAIQKCMSQGFEVIVLMKGYFDEYKNADNYEILKELKELELVRFVEDETDDDEIVLHSAQFYGGAVITRDKYRQPHYKRYEDAKSRLIQYYFSKSNILPENYHLEENIVDMFAELKFLNFESAYAKPGDVDFDKVNRIYEEYRNSNHSKIIYPRVKVLCEYYQLEMCQAHLVQPPTLLYFNTQKQCPLKFSKFKDEYLQNKNW